eukprot:gene1096-2131_t
MSRYQDLGSESCDFFLDNESLDSLPNLDSDGDFDLSYDWENSCALRKTPTLGKVLGSERENDIVPRLTAIQSRRGASTAIWTEDDCRKLLTSPTNPIGKFLRDMELDAADTVRLGIMADLEQAPRKVRRKYGKRKVLSEEQRAELSRERNREHARSTRRRKKVFLMVLERKLVELERDIILCFESQAQLQECVRHRREMNMKSFFSLLLNTQHVSRAHDDIHETSFTFLPAVSVTVSELDRIAVSEFTFILSSDKEMEDNNYHNNNGRGGGGCCSYVETTCTGHIQTSNALLKVLGRLEKRLMEQGVVVRNTQQYYSGNSGSSNNSNSNNNSPHHMVEEDGMDGMDLLSTLSSLLDDDQLDLDLDLTMLDDNNNNNDVTTEPPQCSIPFVYYPTHHHLPPSALPNIVTSVSGCGTGMMTTMDYSYNSNNNTNNNNPSLCVSSSLCLECVSEEVVVQGIRGACSFVAVLTVHGQPVRVRAAGQMAAFRFCDGTACVNCAADGMDGACGRVVEVFLHISHEDLVSELLLTI